jgi:hypothetical protein
MDRTQAAEVVEARRAEAGEVDAPVVDFQVLGGGTSGNDAVRVALEERHTNAARHGAPGRGHRRDISAVAYEQGDEGVA